MNDQQIASVVSMTSKFLNDQLEGASIPDKFVTRSTLISQLAFDVGTDETPEIAIRMLGQQVKVYLDACDPATRRLLLLIIINYAAKQIGMSNGVKA
jgi:hypothetical protein